MSWTGMDEIQITQRSFARKAEREPEHRFDDLYHLLHRKEWMEAALDKVLQDQGSRTAGVDGVTRRQFANPGYRERFVDELRGQLKAGTYEPQPVRRSRVPQADGRKRPLGILAIRDQVVQMMLRMILEPIWESDFLPCSNGFRPGRRTMDCIAPCFRLIHPQKGYYWIIEGGITGCFGHAQHKKLLELVARRIGDRRVLKLVRQMLEAGVMEGALFKRTAEGMPRGGIISPLLANIYLHELDRWWWSQWGRLTDDMRRHRRAKGQNNVMMTRYAGDLILLCNGTKAQAEEVREALRTYLAAALYLELDTGKARLTHATEGFDFLGFSIRLYDEGNTRPHLRVKPSSKSVQRFKEKVRQMTRRSRVFDPEREKVQAINRLCRGWIAYYKHVSAKAIASELSFWVNERVVAWLVDKHRKGVRWVLERYRSREKQGHYDRWNIGVSDGTGGTLYLYLMRDQRITPYRQPERGNPYLKDGYVTVVEKPEWPAETEMWSGHTPNNAGTERRAAVRARDGYRKIRSHNQPGRLPQKAVGARWPEQ